jgi:DNA-binding transcriptional MerR regulator
MCVLEETRIFTIGKAADELCVTSAWLRFGERLGAVPRARRAANGWRYYTPEDIERLRRLGVGERKRRLEGSREKRSS